MSHDMYTDLERSIHSRVEAVMPVMVPPIWVNMQQFVDPNTSETEHPIVININKLIDRYAPENGGGDGAKLVVPNLTTHVAAVSPWPNGFLVGYDFVVYSSTLLGARAAEEAIRLAFPPRRPLYLLDTTDPDHPIQTSSYADVTYGLYINRDDSVQRKYQRHIQVNFDVFNYLNVPAVAVPLIQEIHQTVATPTIAEQL